VVAGVAARVVLRPKPTIHHVVVAWHAGAAVPGVTAVSYNVYRRTASDAAFKKIASRVPGFSYDDGTATGGQTYFYKVTANDQHGAESKFSTEVKAVVP
jgi:fibronectin type 3 domain-containing protein